MVAITMFMKIRSSKNKNDNEINEETMKKNIFYTAALLLAGAVMAACSGSEDIMGNNTAEPQTPTEKGAVVLKGTLGSKGSNDNMTRAVASNGTGTWSVGDQFAIYYETVSGHATAVATVNSVNDNGSANFTATLYDPKIGDNDATLVYPASVHDGQGGITSDALTQQNGSDKNRLDIEKVSTTLSVEEQEGEAPKAMLKSTVTMVPQVCAFNLFAYKSNGTPLLVKKLEISDGMHSYTINSENYFDGNFVFEMFPADGADFTFTATVEETIYTKLDNVTLANCGLEHIGCVIDKDGNVYSASKGSDVLYNASFSNKTLTAGKLYMTTMRLTPSGTSDDVTPVAMIAYVGSNGSVDDSSTDTETGYHGLAIAMENCTVYNSGKDNFITPRGTISYLHTVWCTQCSEACTPECTTDIAVAREWKNGINMTSYLIEHSTGEHNHYAAKAARAYNVERPADCSSWFLPSLGQWDLIIRGLITKQDNLSELYSTAITTTRNNKMRQSYYVSIFYNADVRSIRPGPWTCSEASNENTWLLSLNSGLAKPSADDYTGTKADNSIFYGRSVFAF